MALSNHPFRLSYGFGRSKQKYVSPRELAALYARVDEKNKAIVYLEKAYQERCLGLVWIGVDPKWDHLRSDARFQELVGRLEEEMNRTRTD